MTVVRLATILTWLTLASCAPALRSGGVIDRYNRADCVELEKSASRNGRFEALLGSHTARVVVEPGFSGQVDLIYLGDAEVVTAAKVGDYFRPVDVRIDPARDVLYVRTEGCRPIFGGCGTTLFEFDLKRREAIDRKRVDADLSAICKRP